VGRLCRKGLHEAFVDGRGQGQWFGIAEDFDGFARGIDYDPAVVATGQVLFQGLDLFGFQFPVEVF